MCGDCDILWIASSGDQKELHFPCEWFASENYKKLSSALGSGFKLCWMEIKCEWKALKFDRSALEVSKHGREPTCKVWKYWWIHISRLNMLVLYIFWRNRLRMFILLARPCLVPKQTFVVFKKFCCGLPFSFWYRKFGSCCLFVLVYIYLRYLCVWT